jgi:mannose-1-phosphate guanylyltransferase/mannose-6-phosphate isomerase
MNLQPVILAGGSGTRLWPLSRQDMPKQFLPLIGEHTMLQDTALRLAGLPNCEPPIVVCNEAHRFLVVDQLASVGIKPAAVILEPEGRNTAPALTLAALEALSKSGDDSPLLLTMPADHAIRDAEGFRSTVSDAASVAACGYLVTFGVTPTAPETGYGYIRTGSPLRDNPRDLIGMTSAGMAIVGSLAPSIKKTEALVISKFVEKPDAATALSFLTSGDYLWNSGIFLMSASVWLQELNRHRPGIAAVCEAAVAGARRTAPYVWPDQAIFATSPSESIDYAVMERAEDTPVGEASPYAVLPLNVGWSDVGTWSTVWEMGEQDADGNQTQGDVYLQDVKNSLLVSRHRLLAGIGLEDIVVIETADAVLVAHKDQIQEVKKIVATLGEEKRQEKEGHPHVHRPWGSYEVIDTGPGFQVKRLIINPGAAISLQRHYHRTESWVVVRGVATVTRGDEVVTLAETGATDIPAGMIHRMENPGSIPLEVIEVQQGDYLGEDDIIRLDDKYGRHVDR